jgi:hypothetical protein
MPVILQIVLGDLKWSATLLLLGGVVIGSASRVMFVENEQDFVTHDECVWVPTEMIQKMRLKPSSNQPMHDNYCMDLG